MALIEGVGDEVTLLFGVVFLLLILILAWASTHTAEPPEHLVPSSPGSVTAAEPESQEPHPPGDITSPPRSPREDDKTEAGAERGAEGHESSAEAAGGESLLGADGLRHRDVPGPSLSTQPPASASSATQASTSEDVPNNTERNMVLRLKFLNDTERIAQVNPDDTIGYIKRTYFAGQEHQVRLIYQGQLLQDDAQTLASLNLADNCVLHCHISQHATRAVPAGARAADQVHVALNVGSLMVPLFVLMLSVLWYFQFQYRQFFTAPATASLVGITIFFSFVAFGVYRR
ncbi:transmembrane and ubiquitin-like domain-containing protein 1 [Pangasianodon hypophthalmus]|uniref:transmembrane and ubiquitin-like domain-containing protein 1 n=1 Tax=Pangasianodon hypophthalmus TaxID=310915 RepID=UPI0023076B0F|nr:transmembrane and ubiquitin-like domain-containing protein 1 [Pangasianodon hypophthalmus]XP_034159093.2 transmembrane and ubiquitin-like domain-containing protein 1 [Pangasianodon hypophthalmus]